MSFNKLKYDNCAYKHNLNESVGTLAYVLDPSKYENCNKCRMELGILGGTNVSHIKGNLVDLETDLRGTTRHATKCPSKKYLNPCPNGNMNECNPGNIIIEQNAGNSGQVLDTNMHHLQPCQMIKYRNTPLEPEIPKVLCPQTERVNNNNKQESFRNTNVNAANSFENYSPF